MINLLHPLALLIQYHYNYECGILFFINCRRFCREQTSLSFRDTTTRSIIKYHFKELNVKVNERKSKMPAVAPAGPAGQGEGVFGQLLIDQGLLPPPASAVQQKETLLPPEGAEADAGPTAFFGKETALAADELAAGPGTFNLFDTMEELDYQTCIPETEEQETLKILKELLKTFIPLNVLEVSKIGIRIQEIVDKYPVDTQLHSLAKLLIQRWKNSKEDDEPDIRYAIAYYHEEGTDIKAEYVAAGVKMKMGKKDSTLPKKTAMKNASTAPMKKVSAKAAAARDLFGLNEEAEDEDEQEDLDRLFAAGEDVEEEARNKKDQKQLRRHKTDDGDEDEDDDFLNDFVAANLVPGGTTKKTDEKTRRPKAAAATAGASMLKPRARKATSKAAQETNVIGDEPAAAVPSPAAKQDKKKVVKGGMKKAAAEKKENAAPAMKSSKAAGAAAGGKKMNKKSAGADVFGASPGEPAQEQYGAAGVASSGGKKSAQAQIAVKTMKTARSKPGADIGDDQQQHEPNASVVETGTAGGDTSGTADAARPAAKKMNVMKSMKSLDVAAPAAPAEGAAPVATAETAVVGEDAKAKDHEPAPARGMKTSKAAAGGAAKSTTAMKMKKAEKKGEAADVLAQPEIAAAADDDVEMEFADGVPGGADVQQLLAEASSSSPADGKMKKAPGGPMKRKPKAKVAPAASNPVDADELRDNTIDEQQTAAAIGAASSSAATGRADEEVVGTANKMKAPAMKRKQEASAAVQAAGGESLNLIEKPCEEEDAVAPKPAKKAKMAAKRKADKVAEQPPVAASNPNQKEAAVVELPGAAAAEEKSAAEQSAPAMKKMSMKATPPAVNGAAVEEVKVDTANDTGLAAMKKRGRPAASKNMKTAEAAATSSSALEQLDAKDEAGAAASSSKASVPAVDTVMKKRGRPAGSKNDVAK